MPLIPPRVRALGLLGGAALAAGCAGDPDTGATGDGWLVPAEELGPPLASGGQMDLSDGARAWEAMEQVLPFLVYPNPGSDIPLAIWDLASSDRVADMGACPAIEGTGGTTSYKTWGCRSTQGYEWTGEISTTEWTDEATGWRWYRWDMDLAVEADVDEPRFDRLALEGAFVYVLGDDETLRNAVQVNARARLEGYWERQAAGDPREALWSDWVLTARYEQTPDRVARMQGAAELGGEGFTFASEALAYRPGCPDVPAGAVSLQGAQAATLAFREGDACGRCADLSVDGSDAGLACAR